MNAPLVPETVTNHPLVRELVRTPGRTPASCPRVIHAADEMFLCGLEAHQGDRNLALSNYFQTGRHIFDALEQIVTWYFRGFGNLSSFLEFASGFGRVTRLILQELPAHRIWAADINPEAVRFQREQHGVHGVVSATDPAVFPTEQTFDCIFACAFFSSMPMARFIGWLDKLYSLLNPGGLLIFSTFDLETLPLELVDPADGLFYRPVSEISSLDPEEYGNAFVTEPFVRAVVADLSQGAGRLQRILKVISDEQDLYLLSKPPHRGAETLRFWYHPNGAVDEWQPAAPGVFVFRGWAADPNPCGGAEVRVLVNGGVRQRCRPDSERPDVAEQFQSEAYRLSGWTCTADLGNCSPDDVVTVKTVSSSHLETVLFLGTVATLKQHDVVLATRDLMERGHRVLAYGGLDSLIESVPYPPALAFPQFASHGCGSRLVDSTGKEYVDWFIGYGPMLLGYRHPAVEAAVLEQLHKGTNFSLMHPLEVEIAELLTRMIPCAEQVAFGKNGSDATCAAVRVARAHTGRDVILSCGYHGFHDWYLALNPASQGVPAVLRDVVASFAYNDLAALEQLLSQHEGQVAAVILDPVQDAVPAPGFLEGVQELTRRAGAVLIFDEVITGFRFSPGGAQEVFGVVPDLTCLGKALANGHPLSALVGRADVLRVLPTVCFDLTFRGEALSLAAAHAALTVYRDEPVCDRVAEAGETMRNYFLSTCERLGLPWGLSGHPARMHFQFAGAGRISAEGAKYLFLQECLKRGVFFMEIVFPSYTLGPAELEQTTAALDGALETVAQALGDGRLEEYLHFPAAPFFFCET